MRDDFYTSYAIGILIGVLLCLIILLLYIVITENSEREEIKLTHAMIIKSQENIAKQLQCDLYDECGQFNTNN